MRFRGKIASQKRLCKYSFKVIIEDDLTIFQTSSVTRWQDRFSIFGLCNHENLANTFHKISKVGSKCCQILTSPKNVAEYLYHFAKVAKFRQIWSRFNP